MLGLPSHILVLSSKFTLTLTCPNSILSGLHIVLFIIETYFSQVGAKSQSSLTISAWEVPRKRVLEESQLLRVRIYIFQASAVPFESVKVTLPQCIMFSTGIR